MLHALTSLLTFWRSPSRLLLTAGSGVTIQPISPDDVPALWDLLVPGKKGQLAVDYVPLAYRAAQRRLNSVISQLQQRGGTVRGAFLCEDGDSQAYHYPALPIGLLKLYSELPKAARTLSYAPVQRWHKDEKGWLWLAVLLAEPNTHRAPVVTPAPALAAVPGAPDLLSRLMDVPAQPTYPAPVQVQDLPPLREDSEAITRPLPIEDDGHKDVDSEQSAADTSIAAAETTQAPVVTPPAPVVTQPATRPQPQATNTIPLARRDPSGRSRSGWQITFGQDCDGQWIYVPLKHGAVVNATDGGKTNVLDILLGQLQHAGIEVWYGTVKHVPVSPTDKLDRRPLFANLPTSRRAFRKDDMLDWLHRAASCVQRRYDAMQEQPGVFPEPMVIILDELKAYLDLIADEKDPSDRRVALITRVNSYLRTLIVLGSECRVYLTFTSQDGYCGSIDMTRGEMRSLGYRLVHWNMDETTKRNLLPENYGPFGRLTEFDWLCATGNDVQVVQVPRVSEVMLRAWGLTNHTPHPTPTMSETVALSQPAQQLSHEDLIRKVATLKGITLPVSLDHLHDPLLLPVLKIAVTRGMKTLPIARIVFDAEKNGRFRSDKLDPVLDQLRSGNI